MKTKIIIASTQFDNEVLLLNAESNMEFAALKPMEQMLVDSDNLSFIYIMDYNNDYIYISIPDTIWHELKQALDCHSNVFLNIYDDRLQLPNFLEELSYLIDNIEGNGNYGEQLVEKVEHIFHK